MLVNLKESRIVIERIKIDHDPKIVNFSYNIETPTDGKSSSVLNVTYYLFKKVDEGKVGIDIKTPESDSDTKFSRQLYRTSVSLAQLSKIVGGSHFFGYAFATIFKSLDFKLEPPWDPGYYRLVNFTYAGEHLPFQSTKLLLQIKLFVKFVGEKKQRVAYTLQAFCKLN